MKRFLSILLLIFLTSVPSLLFIANYQVQEEEKMANYHPGHHRTPSENVVLSSHLISVPGVR
ncbi:hypothetical protein [Niabella aurantiaca]|uniref:hypothetical protein n=1 Tax=Niabella aurantiaca TaxID=379900 RepID=UPI00039F855D|nr:hypothetical protein [Niabella aurantiaca]